jgi:hypothetical protein
MLRWASTMLANNARSPDPKHVGERWREMWLERMEKTPPFIEAWLAHQGRDAFWKHGSVCEDYSAITCAVYAVGGWADGYTNAVPRLLAGLSCPRKGLIGPWAHNYPEAGVPGPAIGFLQESLRWWDHWLKGRDTGIMDEPMLRVWMQESVEPSSHYAERPGCWVAEPAWPSPNIETRTYWMNAGTLDAAPASERTLQIRGAQHTGLDAGVWCPYGVPGDMPSNQRGEDGLCLCFDTPPLTAPLEILGFPEVTLTVAVDRPNALLAVRLCDVSPTGASLLVSRGLLNLTHRDSHEHPTPLQPGERYTVTVGLSVAAHSLPAGHRWRVAVSPTYWPFAWPSPEPVTLSVFTGAGSRLALPVRPPRDEETELAPFGPVETSAPLEAEVLRTPSRERTTRRDDIRGVYQIVDRRNQGMRRLVASGLEIESFSVDAETIIEGDPLSAEARCERTIKIGRGDWQTRMETVSTMTSDAETFYVTNGLDAYEGNTRIFSKSWTFRVRRDWV